MNPSKLLKSDAKSTNVGEDWCNEVCSFPVVLAGTPRADSTGSLAFFGKATTSWCFDGEVKVVLEAGARTGIAMGGTGLVEVTTGCLVQHVLHAADSSLQWTPIESVFRDGTVGTMKRDVGVAASEGEPEVDLRRMGVFIVNFGEEDVACSVDELAQNLWLGDDRGHSMVSTIERTSFGAKVVALDVTGDGTHDLFGPFSIERNLSAGCDYKTWADDVDELVARAGIDTSPFQHLVYVLPYSDQVYSECAWRGLGDYGCSHVCRIWTLSCEEMQTFVHEAGHNFLFAHAASYLRERGEVIEYGDPTAVMGNSWFDASWVSNFNAPHKAQAGWITPTQITVSGTYTLSPLDRPQHAPTSPALQHPQSLTIVHPLTAQTYSLSYNSRVGDGFDGLVLVHVLANVSTPSLFVRAIAPRTTATTTVTSSVGDGDDEAAQEGVQERKRSVLQSSDRTADGMWQSGEGGHVWTDFANRIAVVADSVNEQEAHVRVWLSCEEDDTILSSVSVDGTDEQRTQPSDLVAYSTAPLSLTISLFNSASPLCLPLSVALAPRTLGGGWSYQGADGATPLGLTLPTVSLPPQHSATLSLTLIPPSTTSADTATAAQPVFLLDVRSTSAAGTTTSHTLNRSLSVDLGCPTDDEAPSSLSLSLDDAVLTFAEDGQSLETSAWVHRAAGPACAPTSFSLMLTLSQPVDMGTTDGVTTREPVRFELADKSPSLITGEVGGPSSSSTKVHLRLRLVSGSPPVDEDDQRRITEAFLVSATGSVADRGGSSGDERLVHEGGSKPTAASAVTPAPLSPDEPDDHHGVLVVSLQVAEVVVSTARVDLLACRRATPEVTVSSSSLSVQARDARSLRVTLTNRDRHCPPLTLSVFAHPPHPSIRVSLSPPIHVLASGQQATTVATIGAATTTPALATSLSLYAWPTQRRDSLVRHEVQLNTTTVACRRSEPALHLTCDTTVDLPTATHLTCALHLATYDSWPCRPRLWKIFLENWPPGGDEVQQEVEFEDPEWDLVVGGEGGFGRVGTDGTVRLPSRRPLFYRVRLPLPRTLHRLADETDVYDEETGEWAQLVTRISLSVESWLPDEGEEDKDGEDLDIDSLAAAPYSRTTTNSTSTSHFGQCIPREPWLVNPDLLADVDGRGDEPSSWTPVDEAPWSTVPLGGDSATLLLAQNRDGPFCPSKSTFRTHLSPPSARLAVGGHTSGSVTLGAGRGWTAVWFNFTAGPDAGPLNVSVQLYPATNESLTTPDPLDDPQALSYVLVNVTDSCRVRPPKVTVRSPLDDPLHPAVPRAGVQTVVNFTILVKNEDEGDDCAAVAFTPRVSFSLLPNPNARYFHRAPFVGEAPGATALWRADVPTTATVVEPNEGAGVSWALVTVSGDVAPGEYRVGVGVSSPDGHRAHEGGEVAVVPVACPEVPPPLRTPPVANVRHPLFHPSAILQLAWDDPCTNAHACCCPCHFVIRRNGTEFGRLPRNEVVTSPTGTAPHFFYDLAAEAGVSYSVALVDRRGVEGLPVGLVLGDDGGVLEDAPTLHSVALLWSSLCLSFVCVAGGCVWLSIRLYRQGVMHLQQVSLQSRRADRSGHAVFERIALDNLAAHDDQVAHLERELDVGGSAWAEQKTRG